MKEGRIAIVTTREAGMRWTRSAERNFLRGRAVPSRTEKSCGPDTPTLVSSAHAYEARARREQQSPVPGESTKDTVKTIAQGMPDDSAEPVVPSPCFFYARGPWVAASTRHSLRPLLFRGRFASKARARSCCENVDARVV